MANTSDDIKKDKEKLDQAYQLKKKVEELNVWANQLTTGEAKVQYISLVGPNSTYLSMDEANYQVNEKSKAFVAQMLAQKMDELNQQVHAILVDVEGDLP